MQKAIKDSGLANAFGVLVYVVAVATLMQNGDRIFGEMDNFVGPVAFLLLFVLSAAIVGGLVVGKPAMLYFDGKKKEAVTLLISICAWIAVFVAIALIIAALTK